MKNPRRPVEPDFPAIREARSYCGVRAFGIGNSEAFGRKYGVNLGCLDDVSDDELAAAPVTYVDGRDDNWHEAPVVTWHM